MLALDDEARYFEYGRVPISNRLGKNTFLRRREGNTVLGLVHRHLDYRGTICVPVKRQDAVHPLSTRLAEATPGQSVRNWSAMTVVNVSSNGRRARLLVVATLVSRRLPEPIGHHAPNGVQ